jgi:hypothetical protein
MQDFSVWERSESRRCGTLRRSDRAQLGGDVGIHATVLE